MAKYALFLSPKSRGGGVGLNKKWSEYAYLRPDFRQEDIITPKKRANNDSIR